MLSGSGALLNGVTVSCDVSFLDLRHALTLQVRSDWLELTLRQSIYMLLAVLGVGLPASDVDNHVRIMLAVRMGQGMIDPSFFR